MPKKGKNVKSNLESIIKVEPEEFQETSLDNILRSRANIISEPVVLLERLPVDAAIWHKNKRTLKFDAKSLNSFLRKCYEGRHPKDAHTCCFCHKTVSARSELKQHITNAHIRSTKMFCDLCPKIYFSKKTIGRHMVDSHCKKRFTCNICEYKTADKYSFQRHKQTHEAKETCPICKKKVSILRQHLISHRPGKSCLICKKIIKGSMKKHMQAVHGQIKCKQCVEVFENKEKLRRHELKVHHNGDIYECHCGSVFKLKRILNIHMLKHDRQKLSCEICMKQFSEINSLKGHWKVKHLQTHGEFQDNKTRILHGNGPFICDKCGTKCLSRKSFKRHNSCRHFRATIIYHCDLCSRSFNKKYQIKDHLERVHLKLKRTKCKHCNYGCFLQSDLEKHMQQHGPKTKCELCSKLVQNMKYHLQSHNKVNCPICSENIAKYGLNKHIRMQHSKNPVKNVKKIQCKQCPEFFENWIDMRRHNLTKHYNGRLFECHCGSVFKLKSILKSHQLIHNRETKTCGVCQKQFSSYASLQRHWRLKHSQTHREFADKIRIESKVVNRNGPFICDKCGKKLSSRDSFQFHNSSRHSRIKRVYSCDLCPRSCGYKCSLKQHIERDHLKLLPFECKDCNFRCFQEGRLKKHVLCHGPKIKCKLCDMLVSNMRTHLQTHDKANCRICKKAVMRNFLKKHIQKQHKSHK